MSTDINANEYTEALSAIQAASTDRTTAYELTKIACDAITKSGKKIPSWMVLRSLIGKGSANDINRAKVDYHIELGEQIRNNGQQLSQIPTELVDSFLSLWTVAQNAAYEQYAEARMSADQLIAEAENRVTDVEEKYTIVINQLAYHEKENGLIKKNNELLSDQLAETKKASIEAGRRFESSLNEKERQLNTALELTEQERQAHEKTRQKAETTINSLNQELTETATRSAQHLRNVERLEAEVNQHLSRVGQLTESRQKDQETISTLQEKISLTENELTQAHMHINSLTDTVKTHRDHHDKLQSDLDAANQKIADLMESNNSLKEQLAASTATITAINDENQRKQVAIESQRKDLEKYIRQVTKLELELTQQRKSRKNEEKGK